MNIDLVNLNFHRLKCFRDFNIRLCILDVHYNLLICIKARYQMLQQKLYVCIKGLDSVCTARL